MKQRGAKKMNVAEIPVVIFCGGKGTRLKEETEFIPKPMVRIGDRPILWHIMKIYYAQGFRKFILLLGYKGEKIREYVNNYALYVNDFTLSHNSNSTKLRYHGKAPEGWQISCIDTGLETQTGGRLKKVAHFIKAPIFMLTYGDGVANVDLHALLKEHKSKKRLVTMTAVHPPVRFGELLIDQGDVVGFYEKPQQSDSHTKEHLINGGFMVVDSRIFSRMGENDDLVLEKDVLTTLAKDRQLAVLSHRGYWQCMDTLRDMEVLNEAWKSGQAPWKLWE